MDFPREWQSGCQCDGRQRKVMVNGNPVEGGADAPVSLVPYYSWDNRSDRTSMRVWLKTK